MSAFTFQRTAIILFFLVVAAMACLMPAQSDTWWHLREGEVLWSGGALLTDYFSHTVALNYWQDREWLSQVVFFAIYAIGRLPLLTLFCAAIVTGAWYAVWSLMDGSLWRRIFLTAVGVVASSPQWSLRPQIFTLGFVALTMLMLSRVSKAPRALWLLVPMFLVWANLHAGVFIGFALLGVAAAWSSVHRPAEETRRMIAVAAAAFVVTAITPLGVSLWTETFSAARRMQEAGIAEFSGTPLTDPALVPFWLLSAALVALTVAERPWERDSSARDFPVVAAVALLPLGVIAARNAAIVVLVGVPAVHHLMASRFGARESRQRHERPYANAALLATASILALVVVGYAWTSRGAHLGWTPVPSDVTASVESCRPTLYNRFEDGGPLIWFARSQKVFIDNRFDPYPTSFLKAYVAVEATGNYRALFYRFGINCAAIPRGSVVASRLRDDGWHVMADDGGWMVLERPYEETAGDLATAGLESRVASPESRN